MYIKSEIKFGMSWKSGEYGAGWVQMQGYSLQLELMLPR